MPETIAETNRPTSKSPLVIAGISALGVVFGDIGTSPLYTLKTVFDLTGSNPEQKAIFGVLSLIIWTLIMITSIKYVTIAMRVDNDGEGGILALMALLVNKIKYKGLIAAVGLLGAALIYGDGAITPAISVLSALEGLNMIAPAFKPYVLPTAVIILISLFIIQPQGTARIGKAFGPIMMIWFFTIGILGIWGIIQHPIILRALNPYYGLDYLCTGGMARFLVLGGVFLCVTGAEALYADMGHFGAGPIRLAWSALVFPSLILNYAGQAALVLGGAPTTDNIFYRLCPASLFIPLVILSTVATIIASQSIITSAFSMTRQAIHLGWLPRLRITQTSAVGYGQIYVGSVNWILMVVTLALTLGFKKSDNLASAYGIAVSATMFMTSVLLMIALPKIRGWSLWMAGGVIGIFLIIDAAFFTANLAKVLDGGYVPIILALSVYGMMCIWHYGCVAMYKQLHDKVIPITEFLKKIAPDVIPRVPGTAIFLTRIKQDTPPVMVWHLKHNRSLHQQLVALTLTTEIIPWVPAKQRLDIEQIAPDFWRMQAHYGFMENPNIPVLLKQAKKEGCSLDLSDTTYYVGHETTTSNPNGKGLPRWITLIFAFMQRNSLHISDHVMLPPDSVVEIGRQIAI